MANSDSKAVFDYIFGLTVPGVKLELSRVREFMDRIGRPYADYPVIHIAGTNGKGSTAAMLAAILGATGKQVGLFTSPHLIKPNERIRIGDALVSDDFIIQKVEAWRPHIDELGITFFEVLTALGMEYFKQQAVDYAVIETGLGGRLDATNVVSPELSIITSVSLDHENILGHDLGTIAGEKAGIIKQSKPVILSLNPEVVTDVIRKKSLEEGAELTYVPDKVKILGSDARALSQLVSVRVGDKPLEIDLPLLGNHQVENLTNVLAALDVLGFTPEARIIQQGLDKMNWQGRMQVMQKDPPVLYDVAHNPEGLRRLLASLSELGRDDTIIIAAFNARKNLTPMQDLLDQWPGEVIYSAFEGHSAVQEETLIHMGINPGSIAPDLNSAYTRAVRSRDHDEQAICFIGSHYMAEIIFPMFDRETA